MSEPEDRGPISGWRPPDASVASPRADAGAQGPRRADAGAESAPRADARPAGSTSLLIVVAAIFLLVLGILTFGMGTLLLLAALLVSGAGGAEGIAGDVAASLGGLVVIFALLVLLWAVLEMVAAIGMLGHRRWGRLIGLAIGGLGLAFGGLSLLSALGAGGADGPSIGFNLALVAGYGLTVLALATAGEHFRRT
jgi:hypothetical protein